MQNQLMQTTCLKHCTNLSLNLQMDGPEELCLRRCISKYNEALKLFIKEENTQQKTEIQTQSKAKPEGKSIFKRFGF
ncbi:unnamed protein product (macronuclear) [Paramecium tetraurelia]|uniref:Tim10-like domain-containing protein n=1 Tax=Paramecium tetraurelia TaxID=5888 RepID=A0BR65_PARTE|nr:uncharacterized protein GSPATT00031262001 [Paramecium tetraurelia]CAK61032.1 unnamed protein product [Paramecium tetraurelia]|eukprot:XP_001428430.1 hypothetical protein (macronuclear) [Paramecium tetraurelia strain d4-2]